MRQAKTRQALDYWMKLFREAGNTPHQDAAPVWPERSAVTPSQCAPLLGDMFIVDLTSVEPTYRLAGTRLCRMFGSEMKDEPFAQRFRREDRNVVTGWADHLHSEGSIVLLCSRAANKAGETLTLETLLLPLSSGGRSNERILGVTVACASPYWLGEQPVEELTLLSARAQRPWKDLARMDAPSLIPRNKPVLRDDQVMRRVRHLALLDGGLSHNETTGR